MSDTHTPFAEWCVVELMGHRRLGGYVTEVEIAGAGFLRVDVPGSDGETAATQLFRPASVYALTPVTEEMARAVAASCQPETVARWELLDRSTHHVGVDMASGPDCTPEPPPEGEPEEPFQ